MVARGLPRVTEGGAWGFPARIPFPHALLKVLSGYREEMRLAYCRETLFLEV